MNSRIINPFLEATIQTLQVMCHLSPKTAKPFLKGVGHQEPCEVIAVTSLQSRDFYGVVALCFPTEVFLRILGGVMKDSFAHIPKKYEDSPSELLNVIFGHARTLLLKEGYTIDYSIPGSSTDGEREFPHYTPSETFVLPFFLEEGPFYLEIGLTEISPAQKAAAQ